MLTLQIIREKPEEVIRGLEKKGFKETGLIARLQEIDSERRKIQKQLEEVKARSNQIAKEIGALFKEGKKEEAENLKVETGTLKQKEKLLGEELENREKEQNNLLVMLPNLPYELVKPGKSAEDNEVVFEWGKIGTLPKNSTLLILKPE
jgi:seryl-tRNA synthetase